MSGRYAVIGDPIAHSLSPVLFAWLQNEGAWSGTYDAWRVRAAELGEALAEVRRGHYGGLSVTVPHKEAVLPLLDEVSPLARRLGAVNCVVRDEAGRLSGHNTDAEGFSQALRRHEVSVAGQTVLLLGAGGAARAAAFIAEEQGTRSLRIANRDRQRAEALGAAVAEGARAAGRALIFETAPLTRAALPSLLDGVGLVVNATTVGLSAPADSPWPEGLAWPSGAAALDMVYRPLETRFLATARVGGGVCVDGLWMLVYQGLGQLRLWTGYEGAGTLAEGLHGHLAQHLTGDVS